MRLWGVDTDRGAQTNETGRKQPMIHLLYLLTCLFHLEYFHQGKRHLQNTPFRLNPVKYTIITKLLRIVPPRQMSPAKYTTKLIADTKIHSSKKPSTSCKWKSHTLHPQRTTTNKNDNNKQKTTVTNQQNNNNNKNTGKLQTFFII